MEVHTENSDIYIYIFLFPFQFPSGGPTSFALTAALWLLLLKLHRLPSKLRLSRVSTDGNVWGQLRNGNSRLSSGKAIFCYKTAWKLYMNFELPPQIALEGLIWVGKHWGLFSRLTSLDHLWLKHKLGNDMKWSRLSLCSFCLLNALT